MKINVFLLFVTAVTAIAGFLYGYDTGIISGALIPIKNEFHLDYPMQERAAWLIVFCLLSYMFFSAGGIQVVGWLTGSEMYPLSVRCAGSNAQAATVWGTNLLVTGTALSMVHALGTRGLMWVYGAMNVLAFWFVYRLVPETAGRSLEDIEQSLRAGAFSPLTRRDHLVPNLETA